ncbi:MAG: 4-(cytidine 5'-diphospho)-2-C-methyl-D-erythritol kinase [Bacteroidales bacterium]|nr:4-(cytidine 5'-diphospho)-2-C-methyl-D-erythritol kinase [Bacteroidales bacterium]
MIFFPNAKINLGLFVTGKRFDGYHNIETILYPVPLCDVIELISSPDGNFQFSYTGFPIPGNADENLIVKAWQMLKHDFNLPPVKIHLHKNIPLGAGLGGGSADAAFTILLINRNFQLGLSENKMMEYAAQLGMDCPFFINNTPAYAFERGDKLEKSGVNLSGKFLVIIKPSCHISTVEAYGGIKPSPSAISIKEILAKPLDQWKETLKNDFEKSAFIKCPEIEIIKNSLYKHGSIYAAMSGSGAAVFGIFEKAINLKKHFSKQFYWHGWLK